MQFTTFIALLAATVVGVSAQSDPTINTPSGVTQCLPAQLTFSGTQPPFIIALHPGGMPDSPALFTWPATSANSITWIVNQPAGTSLTLVIRDAAGRTNPSAPFTILPSSDSSCLGGSSVTTSGGVSTSGTSETGVVTSAISTAPQVSTQVPVTTSAAPVVTTSQAVASTSRVSTSSVRSTSSVSVSAAATTSANAANTIQPLGLAGLMGLVGLAALV